ncbi:MAG TPA: hypothetical protein VJ140_10140 [Actinomycetota bacterium]|nr:hypothetical protein [Actinomycetota bacterium]
MRANGQGAADYAELAGEAARAFGVESMLAAWEPGDHWVWDLAIEVLEARRAAAA